MLLFDKGLDSNYIRGYNSTRDTTYRSQRTSTLSPAAQRQAGGTLPESHPTTQNQLPQPPACPELGHDAQLDLQIYESQGQEASERQISPAYAAGRTAQERGRAWHRSPDRGAIAQRFPGPSRRRPGPGASRRDVARSTQPDH